MINNFTDEQKLFLKAEGNIVVKACPGSGKTYTVAHKLLTYVNTWSNYHQGVAVLSFTNVASKEIFEKTNSISNCLGAIQYPHFIGTVDSFINEFIVLRYGYLYTAGRVRPQISLSDNWKMPYRYWRSECHQKGCIDHIEDFHYEVDGTLYKGKQMVTCALGKAKALPCQQYKSMLAKKNVVFQNETALIAYELLNKYPIIASAIVERFPVIIMDEAQDTSITQMALFDLLSKAGLKSLFLVGDPDQAIYEWRNANPECFIEKIKDKSKWKTIKLTGNFRSSQNICNATTFFSPSLRGDSVNIAIGDWKAETQKPILLLTNKNSCEDNIISYFLQKCKSMNITINSRNVAILSRGRINIDTDISGLWKSKEIESFAKAAYEWNKGSRKKSYQITSEASFSMIFDDALDEYQMSQKIYTLTDEDTWKAYIIDILSSLPNIELGINEWVKIFSKCFCDITQQYHFNLAANKDPELYFKIKVRDKKVPNFKEIPLRMFFEKRTEGIYTRSSIHGVKGETYDAVLIIIKSRTGNTLTPKFLMEGNIDSELMRVAYVAMTRSRRLLMITMPETKGLQECKRFSTDIWNYEYI